MAGFGNRILVRRKEQKLTQEQLALAVGVDTDTVGDWEGMNEPPEGMRLKNLQGLSRVLDIPLDELLNGKEAYAAVLKRDLMAEFAAMLAETEARMDKRLKRAGL